MSKSIKQTVYNELGKVFQQEGYVKVLASNKKSHLIGVANNKQELKELLQKKAVTDVVCYTNSSYGSGYDLVTGEAYQTPKPTHDLSVDDFILNATRFAMWDMELEKASEENTVFLDKVEKLFKEVEGQGTVSYVFSRFHEDHGHQVKNLTININNGASIVMTSHATIVTSFSSYYIIHSNHRDVELGWYAETLGKLTNVDKNKIVNVFKEVTV
ncbi:hypothetical protein ACQUY5_18755 [Bacillus cereus]|uniref:hypothetical protein n=1 Tax=Bacillus cereus TaxID=1396 RepID=UPI003D17C2EA